jgi:predicted RNA-binding protein associated with RNAse of E/G family
MKNQSYILIEYVRLPDKISTYTNRLLYKDGKVIVSEGVAHPNRPIIVRDEVVLDEGYHVIWFIFQGEFYDIGKVYDLEENLKGYYCDIIKPAQIVNQNRLRIVDLFLDLWISTSLDTAVLDEEEFDEALENGWIDFETAADARSKLDMLVNLVHGGYFPPRFVTEFEGC